jgi:cysteine desulfurase / selenocysteine lyase
MSNVLKNISGLDPYKIRNDFPILHRNINGKPLVYFDNAATTQKPKQVIECLKNYYQNTNSNIHRGVHTLSYESTVEYENAHKKVAELIGSGNWQEIIFTRNATESLNLIAYSWGLNNLDKGDEVLISIMEHHSNIVPWQMIARTKGINLRFIDVNDDGFLDLEDFYKKLNEKTKVVSLIHASNVLGVINPIDDISKKVKEYGALFIVDAAQSIPHLEIDVKKLGCDFLVASGHKMLGPTGIGFLYGRREILEDMQPFMYGGDMISTVSKESSTWNELPWKFEAGTPNIADAIALSCSIDYLREIGFFYISKHEQELLKYAIDILNDFQWIRQYTPTKGEKVGVLSFNLVGVHPHDAAGILDEDGIAVRSGHHCTQPLMKRLNIELALRASFYIYNTFEEIDKFVKSLVRAHKIFSR